MNLLLRWVVSSLSLFVAAWLVPGIHAEKNSWTLFAVMAIILGLVNAIVRPVLKLLSCPLVILTLGLFVLVINGITLWLASYIAVTWFHVGFYVDGFWAAFWGSLVVSIVSVILTAMLREERRSALQKNECQVSGDINALAGDEQVTGDSRTGSAAMRRGVHA